MNKGIIYPKIGILGCGSNASNSGALVARIALEIANEQNDVGILSLPALANNVPRQVALAKNKIKKIIVIDGCHQSCALKIARSLGIKPDAYVNLELDLGIKKKGPFTTFQYTYDEYVKVRNYIKKQIEELLKG
jgi:uncharacterized metal-binding protein